METYSTYFIFGLIMGILLGVNLAWLYNRVFKPDTEEEKLRLKVKRLKRKLKEKDYYLNQALSRVNRGEQELEEVEELEEDEAHKAQELDLKEPEQSEKSN